MMISKSKFFICLVLTSLLILPSSCVKDEMSSVEKENTLTKIEDISLSNHILPAMLDENTTSNHDNKGDCRCFMRVNSVTNGTNDPNLEAWAIFNGYQSGVIPWFVLGQDQTWDDIDIGQTFDLPSPFNELWPGGASYGWQTFLVEYQEFDPLSTYPNFTINTEVKCYEQQTGGNLVLATTTYHSFNISEGYVQGSNNWAFIKNFSCEILTSGDEIYPDFP